MEMEVLNEKDIPRRKPNKKLEGDIEIVPEERTGHKIDFCTGGRFSAPKELYFKGYSVEDITTLTTSSQEEILETTLAILNKLHGDPQYNSADFLPDEFLETLLNLKVRYNTSKHTHTWLCDCQYSLTEDEQEFSSSEIDLKKIEFIDIKEADNDLKEVYKNYFKNEEDFKSYLKQRYPEKSEDELKEITTEDELENIYIKEPVKIDFKGNSYSFRFPRMKDMILGTKKAQSKYKPEIKKIQKKKIDANKNIREQKDAKKGAIELIKRKIAKDALIYSKALSMIAKNNEPLKEEEKFEEWKEFDPKLANELDSYFNPPFGLQGEFDLWCPHCESTKRRLLRNEPTLIWELLPLDDSSSRGKSGESKRPFIHISI